MRSCVYCLFCALSIITSCISVQFDRQLLDVESYIKDHPDSALCVLESIDVSQLNSNKDRSLHALLHAMALDKNFIDVDDDSLANVALEYFDHHGPRYYKARALYYKGLASYYAENYNLAIIEFSKAEQVSRECGDSLYLGMTYVCLADVYGNCYNDIQEIYYLRAAKECFVALNELYYAHTVDARLGTAYTNAREYLTAEESLSQLLQEDTLDIKVRAQAMLHYAYLHMVMPEMDPRLSDEYYTRVYDMGYQSYMSVRNLWSWAAAMNMVGRKADSQKLIEHLLPISDDYIRDYWQYIICRSNGDNEAALEFYENSSESGNEIVEKTLRQSLAITQRDFYETQVRLEDLKVMNRTMVFVLVFAITLLLVTVSAYFIIRRIRSMKSERVEMMNFAQKLMEQITSEQSARTELRSRFIHVHQAKYDLLGKLCNQYFSLENRVDVEKRMFQKIVSLIDSFKYDPSSHKQFEKMLNRERDDIIKRLRLEMPKLKEVDYVLFCYYLIGFDAMIISRFVGMSESNIYAHKRRLRIKIEKANPQHRDLFFEVFK